MTVLTEDLLSRIRSRAAGYDRDNAFFAEDLDDLRASGYLKSRPLLEVARDQRRLAAHAPATALGINMHLVVVGIARVLSERGDHSLDWIVDEAAAGELFAFGNSEAGNDQVMFDSRTAATPQPDGSYLFSGTKIFTSLSPAWTRLVIFGRDDSEGGASHSGASDGGASDGGASDSRTADVAGPKLVHGVLTRETPGHRAVGEWNPLGMRATQSLTTVLDGARVAPERITRILPVGPVADPYIFGLFADFLLLISSVYAGIADRALELAVENVATRRSMKSGLAYSQDPDIRWQLADAAIALDSLAPQIEGLASDVDGLVDHGASWFRLLVGTKTRSVDVARSVVETAIRVSGGSAYSADTELSRLYRDALAGLFHPSDPESAHGTVATNLLGAL